MSQCTFHDPVIAVSLHHREGERQQDAIGRLVVRTIEMRTSNMIGSASKQVPGFPHEFSLLGMIYDPGEPALSKS